MSFLAKVIIAFLFLLGFFAIVEPSARAQVTAVPGCASLTNAQTGYAAMCIDTGQTPPALYVLSGGSYVPATLNANGVSNVRAFGAKGDGVTDDTAAIQAAIAAVNPTTTATTQTGSYKYGGDVLLPLGKYLISGTLYVPSGVRLIGQGGLQMFTYDFIGGTSATIPISTIFYAPTTPGLAAISLSGYVASSGARMAVDGSLDSAGIGAGVTAGTYVGVQQPSIQNLAIVSNTYFPNRPILAQTAGGTLAATTYYVTIACAGGTGQETQSSESSLAVSANNLLSVTAPTTCRSGVDTGYNVYVSTTSGAETKQNAAAIALGTNWTEPTSGLVSGGAPLAPARLGIQAYAAEQMLLDRVLIKNFQTDLKAHGAWRSSYRNIYGHHFNATCLEINDTASSSAVVGGWCHGDGLAGATGLWLANTEMSVADFQIEQLDTGISLNGAAYVTASVDFDANFVRAIYNASGTNSVACNGCTINLATGSTIPFLDAAASTTLFATIDRLAAVNLAEVLGAGVTGTGMNVRITNTAKGSSENLSALASSTLLTWNTTPLNRSYPGAAEVEKQENLNSTAADLRTDYVFAGTGKYFLVYDQNGTRFKDFSTGVSRFEMSNVAPFPFVLDNGVLQGNESSGATGAGFEDFLWADSTAHRWKMANNGGGAQSVAGIVASGTIALATAAIAAGACATTTAAQAGVAATDAIEWAHAAAVAGGTNGSLIIHPYPTSGNVNFQECNPTGAAITPPADTLNFVVIR